MVAEYESRHFDTLIKKSMQHLKTFENNIRHDERQVLIRQILRFIDDQGNDIDVDSLRKFLTTCETQSPAATGL